VPSGASIRSDTPVRRLPAYSSTGTLTRPKLIVPDHIARPAAAPPPRAASRRPAPSPPFRDRERDRERFSGNATLLLRRLQALAQRLGEVGARRGRILLRHRERAPGRARLDERGHALAVLVAQRLGFEGSVERGDELLGEAPLAGADRRSVRRLELRRGDHVARVVQRDQRQVSAARRERARVAL